MEFWVAFADMIAGMVTAITAVVGAIYIAKQVKLALRQAELPEPHIAIEAHAPEGWQDPAWRIAVLIVENTAQVSLHVIEMTVADGKPAGLWPMGDASVPDRSGGRRSGVAAPKTPGLTNLVVNGLVHPARPSDADPTGWTGGRKTFQFVIRAAGPSDPLPGLVVAYRYRERTAQIRQIAVTIWDSAPTSRNHSIQSGGGQVMG